MIRTDSRKVMPGDTFVALDGINGNGAAYIDSAIEKGAVRVVCKEGTYSVETINVPDPRKHLEKILEEEYKDIISGMTLIGVTGTNGKTTTCYLISQALNALGINCAYIGTIGFYMKEKVRSLPNTSVDICDLYGLLLEAHEKGFDHVALEASSQGLDMGRLHTISFDVAAFTNLTEDHLDYHRNMINYAAAKKILFDSLKDDGCAVLNADDPYYGIFIPEGKKVITFGMKDDRASKDFEIESFGGSEKTELIYSAFGERTVTETALIGKHNMYNIMTCAAALAAIGINSSDIARVIPLLQTPDGRMQKIRYKNCNIVVDYAHTPDAVEKIIETARTFTDNNIYVVFGCTGDREREKRPVMTKIVLSNSKYAIITVDDIHSEAPENIFKDMLEGNTMTNYEIVPDRKEAIRRGIALLKDSDSLLILGKGHEMFIAVDGGNIPHNDKQAVLDLIGEE